jgi:arabinose-5-phosphate isomerase
MNNIINYAREVIKSELLAIERISLSLDNKFEVAIDFLSKADKIIVMGIGKSGIIARKIAATMTSVGTPAIFLHPVEGLHGDIGIVGRNDVALLLSKSGSTEELLRIIPYLIKRKIPIISIVGNLDAPIIKLSDVVLNATIDKEACPLNLAPTASTMAALAIGDALAMVLMKQKEISREDFALLHPSGQIGKNITVTVKEVMHTGTALPTVLPSESFRNALIVSTEKSLGCICVVDTNKKLVGIITDGDIRRILQVHDDIRTLSVSDVMISNPITTNQDALLGDVLFLMEKRPRQISVLPVVDEIGQCIGVIRIHDILTGL